ncbi:MAG: DUF3048 domain-containing protein [Chloroflexota bacterium]
MSMLKRWVFVFTLLVLCLAACSQEEPTATDETEVAPTAVAEAAAPEQEATPEPTAVIAEEPTPVPTNTATVMPTETAVPPTLTPLPTATENPTPTITPMPEPVDLLAAEDFTENFNPFTGEYFADSSTLQRRPITVKISNSPPEWVRPQSGIGDADIVFEHATEGSITRFTALFYGKTPPNIGPIRSARLIDIELPAMYDAALAFSGASIGVAERLGGSDFRARLLRSDEPGYYRTGEEKPWEHTLYADPTGFWQALDEKGENHAPELRNFMAFTSEPPEPDEAASEIQVRYPNFSTIDWKYDAENGRYWRWVDGEPFVDANDGEQISAKNIIAVFAIHQLNRSICEHQVGNTCHAFSTEIQIWNSAPVIIFRDGQRYNGTWIRENRHDMLTFFDDEGNMIPLQIGNSWVQVIPWHYNDPIDSFP